MAKAENYQSDILDDLLGEISPAEMRKTEKRMQLAAKIADALEDKGWSKGEFASKMGKNQQSVVTKWLSGTHNFNIDTLMDIEEVLGISLLNADERPKAPAITFNLTVRSRAHIPSQSMYSLDFDGYSEIVNPQQFGYGGQEAQC